MKLFRNLKHDFFAAFLLLFLVLVSIFGYMPYLHATQMTVVTPKGPYVTSYTANSLDVTFVGTIVGSNTFASTGKELLIMHNAGIGDASFTIFSVVDTYNRKNDIAGYVLGTSEFAVFWFGNTEGWKNQTSADITVNSNTPELQMAVLKIAN